MQATDAKRMLQQFSVADIANGTYFMIVMDEKGNKETKKVVVPR